MSAKTARPSLGFGDDLDAFDPAEFTPAKKAPRPAPETSRKAAEAAGFRSREAQKVEPAPTKVQQRRRRTGRNAQLNLKAKPETIAAFMRIADAKGWGLGEAFEHATALLEQSHDSR